MSRPRLDPTLLRAFLAVAEERSFTRAATHLHLTQSAVSSQIKRLEEELDLELFSRSTTRVDLNPAGEELVGYARRILSLGEEAVQRLRQHDIAGRVRLGVMDDYGTTILPSILKTFCGAYPGIELQMETGLTSGMIARVAKSHDVVLAMHARGDASGEFLRRERTVWPAPTRCRLVIWTLCPWLSIPKGASSAGGRWMPWIVQARSGVSRS